MKELIVIDHDITKPIGSGYKLIIHVVNDQGKMGSGVAKSLFTRWPRVREEYLGWFNKNEDDTHVPFELGQTQFVICNENIMFDDIVVANMVAQHMIGSDENGLPPIRYKALKQCLDTCADYAIRFGFSIHLPYMMGADRARGDWDIIMGMIRNSICKKDINTTIYRHMQKD